MFSVLFIVLNIHLFSSKFLEVHVTESKLVLLTLHDRSINGEMRCWSKE